MMPYESGMTILGPAGMTPAVPAGMSPGLAEAVAAPRALLPPSMAPGTVPPQSFTGLSDEDKRRLKQYALDAVAATTGSIPFVGTPAGLLAGGHELATDPASRTPLNIGLSLADAVPLLGDLLTSTVLKRAPERTDIDLYHGSPYKFDEFSDDYLLTGEGTWDEGPGHYTSDSPLVAQSYAEILRPGRGDYTLNGVPMTWQDITDNFGHETAVAIERKAAGSKHWQKYKEMANAYASRGSHADQDLARRMKESIKHVEGMDVEFKPSPGYVYDLEVPDADVEDYAMWKQNVADQPGGIAPGLMELLGRHGVRPGEAPTAQNLWYQQARAMEASPSIMAEGERIFPEADIENIPELMTRRQWQRRGVGGIIYPDKDFDPSAHNFVVWDPSRITVKDVAPITMRDYSTYATEVGF